MEDLEKKIEEMGRDFVENQMRFSFKSLETLSMARRLLQAYESGAKSSEAKEFHIQGMYTEQDMVDAFYAGRNFQRAEQYEDLTGEDHTVPNFKEWFEQNKKKL